MNDNNNGGNNNWLGFSLSPHMKMEVASDSHPALYHHQTQPPAAAVSSAVPTFFLSHHLNTSGICYGVGETGAFHSPLSVMPLKSDGSLCIMEALSRSQQEGLFLFLLSMFLSWDLKFCLLSLYKLILCRDGANLVPETGGLFRECNHGNSSVRKP